MSTLEKNPDEINKVLEETELVKKILDISKEGAMFKFEGTDRHMSKGFNAFIRKLANKLVDIQTKNSEASNILESIPEWKSYCDGDLSLYNNIENKPLASDPRNKVSNEDDFEYFIKFKSFSSGKSKSTSSAGQVEAKNDDQEEAEEEEDVDLENQENKGDFEEHDEKNYEENYEHEDGNDDLQQYFSNGEGGKGFHDDYEGEPEEDNNVPEAISLDDLMKQNQEEEKKEKVEIKDEFYSNTYWKVEDEYSIDQLMEEY